MRVLVLQGPNLNLLGEREPSLYGPDTLDAVTRRLDELAEALGARLEHFQSNHEGELVDRVQRAAREGVAGAVVNAAARSSAQSATGAFSSRASAAV